MISIRLSPELEERLNYISKKTGRTKSFHVKKALDQYLEEQEDYLLAVESINDPRPFVPYEKIRKKLGLAE